VFYPILEHDPQALTIYGNANAKNIKQNAQYYKIGSWQYS
jgi:hypothetical protein